MGSNCARVLALVPSLGVFGAGASLAQSEPVWEVFGAAEQQHVGNLVALIGDVDGDGVREIAAGDFGSGPSASLWILSGADGSLLAGFTGPHGSTYAIGEAPDANGDGIADLWNVSQISVLEIPELEMRSAVDLSLIGSVQYLGTDPVSTFVTGALIADLDGDGECELAIGQPTYDRVHVLSSVDGHVLATLAGSAPNEGYGSNLASIPDATGDAVGDLVISSTPILTPFGVPPGMVELRSGADLGLIWKVESSLSLQEFGRDCSAAGDIDGDGLEDVAVLAAGGILGNIVESRLEWRRGSDGSLIRQVVIPPSYLVFGEYVVSPAGDVDGDGGADLFLGNTTLGPGLYRMTQIRSGADGSLLASTIGDPDGPYATTPASAVGPLGDLDGDGLLEWVAVSPYAGYGRLFGVRAVQVRRGFRPTLVNSEALIHSATAGGAVGFELAAGPQHAGKPYLVLAGHSGDLAGVDVGGMHLPLTPDALSTFVLTSPNQPPYAGNFGVLDAGGSAHASFQIDPLPGVDLNGVVVQHVGVVLGAGGLDFVSSAASFAFTN